MPDKDWNRKEYKGEMKMKRLSYILLAAMLVAALAVSCTAEVIDDMGLVSVDFEGVRDNGSKGLTVAQATLDVYDSSISWTYKAYKDVGDNTPATGTQTEDNVQLPGGISSGKLTLSQGVWNFELFGYVNGVLVYQGKAIDQSINGKNATVQIKVSPQKNGKNGTLVFAEGIYITGMNNGSCKANCVEIFNIDKTVAYGNYDISTENKISLGSGQYLVVLYCKGSVNEEEFTYAQAETVVSIYDGLETVISGTLDENLAETGFGAIKVDVDAGTTSQSQTVDSTKTRYEFGFSPANSDDTKTVVEVVAGSFVPEAGAKNNTVDLVVYNKDAAEKKFVISDGSGMVFAGLDLSLNGASFAENTKVKVSTYIKAGLPGTPKVVYNGNPSETFDVTYDSTTGRLEFETKHFSEYYVVFEGLVAYNKTTDKYYTSLGDAISDRKKNNSIIELLSDSTVDKAIAMNGGSLIIDLNGKKIKSAVTGNYLFEAIGGIKLTLRDSLGNGEIDASDEITKACFFLYPTWSDFPSLTIEGGVFKAYCYVVAGNGTDKKKNCTSVIIKNGWFRTEGGPVVYQPQNGKMDISGGEFYGADSAIEVRAGSVTISGGKFYASVIPESSDLSVPNGSGTTTKGAAIAVAQHTTKKDVNVVISGGEFEGYSALYESNPQDNDEESIAKVKLEVSGGAFNAVNGGSVAVYSKDCTGFITGGTFNSDPSQYVADGYAAEQDAEDPTIWTVKKAVAEVDGSYFASLEAAFEKALTLENPVMTILDDIDLSGKNWIPIKMGAENNVVKSLTIEGGHHSINNMTITTVAYIEPKGDPQAGGSNYYGGGFIAEVNKKALTIKNLTFNKANVGGSDLDESPESHTSGVSVVVGRNCYSTVTLENVNVIDSTVYGGEKVGALIGHCMGGETNINGGSVKNTTVTCTWYYSAMLIGMAHGGAKITVNEAVLESNSNTYDLKWSKVTAFHETEEGDTLAWEPFYKLWVYAAWKDQIAMTGGTEESTYNNGTYEGRINGHALSFTKVGTAYSGDWTL